jgi:hypothetical protein
MRPEYLAEFEAAGIRPYSQAPFSGRLFEGPDDEPAIAPPYSKPPMPPAASKRQREVPPTRKVILDAPARYATGAVVTNVSSIVLGLGVLFVVGFVVPMLLVFAFLRGMTKASRRGRWHHW